MNDAQDADDPGQRPSPAEQERAKKKAILERARADQAVRGAPTSGLPQDQERSRAGGLAPPRGQTNQTR